MALLKPIASEALRWLDQHMIESSDAPDEAFDWIFMLREGDWQLLESVWDERPPEWREAFAYLVCEGPVNESHWILRRALFDGDSKVAVQAACTLCHHQNIEPDLVQFDSSVVERLQQVFDENCGCHMEEVKAFLAQ